MIYNNILIENLSINIKGLKVIKSNLQIYEIYINIEKSNFCTPVTSQQYFFILYTYLCHVYGEKLTSENISKSTTILQICRKSRLWTLKEQFENQEVTTNKVQLQIEHTLKHNLRIGMIAADDKCIHCNIDVFDNEEALQCDGCDKWIHYACLKQPRVSYAVLSKNNKWYCSSTCKKYSTQTSQVQSNMPVTNAVSQSQSHTNQPNLGDLMKQQAEMFAELKQSINDLTRNVEYHNKQYEDLRNDVNLIRSDVNNIKKNEISMLQTVDNKILNELHHVKLELNNIKQEKLQCNVICFGVPKSGEENTILVVTKLLESYNIPTNAITGCRRIPTKNKTEPMPPIILTFTSVSERTVFLNTCRKIEMKAASVDIPGSTADNPKRSKVIFKELLTPENKKLLDATKAALQTKVKYVWFSKGKILVRKTETDRSVTWIKSAHDVQEVLDSLLVNTVPNKRGG